MKFFVFASVYFLVFFCLYILNKKVNSVFYAIFEGFFTRDENIPPPLAVQVNRGPFI